MITEEELRRAEESCNPYDIDELYELDRLREEYELDKVTRNFFFILLMAAAVLILGAAMIVYLVLK